MAKQLSTASKLDSALAIYQAFLDFSSNHPSDSLTLADVHWEMHLIYDQQGQCEPVFNHLQSYIAIVSVYYPKFASFLATAYYKLGYAATFCSRYDLARNSLDKALAIRHEMGEDRTLQAAYIHDQFGFLLNSLNQNDVARSHFNKALSIYREIQGEISLDVALTYENLSMVLGFSEAEFDSAIYFANRSLEIKNELYGELSPQVAMALNGLAYAYQNAGDTHKAIQLYEQAVDITIETEGKNTESVAFLYDMLGSNYDSIGQSKKALTLYQNALEIRRQIYNDQHPKIAISFYNIGNIYLSLGDYDLGLEYLHMALEVRILVRGSAHADVASTYRTIGTIYTEKSDFEKALDAYQAALKIDLALYDDAHPLIALDYDMIGDVYKRSGDYDHALEYYQKDLSINQKSFGSNHPFLADNYDSIGDILYLMERFPQALESYQIALSIRQQSLDSLHTGFSDSYLRFGRTYRKMKDYEQALEWLNKALAHRIRTFGEDNAEVTFCYNTISHVYADQKDYEQALFYQNKCLALRIAAYGEKDRLTANTYHNIAMIYSEMGDFEQAAQIYHQSLISLIPTFNDTALWSNPTIEQLKLEPRYILSLSDKADCLKEIILNQPANPGALKAVLAMYDLIIELSDRIRNQMKESESKLLLGELGSYVYESAIQIALRLKDTTGDSKYMELALFYAEKNKANVLLSAITEANAKQFAGIPDSLLNQEKQIKIDLAFYENQIAQHANPESEAEKDMMTRWQDKVFYLKMGLDSLMVQFESQYPEYFELKYQSQIPSLAELQSILDDNTVLLEYVLGDSSLFIIGIDQSNIVFHEQKKPANLELNVQRMRQGLLNHDPRRYAKYAHWLYQNLFEPVSLQIADKKIVIVSDGILGYLPFEALLTDKAKSADYTGLPYLLAQNQISYAMSATLFWQNQQNQVTPSERALFAFAPVFSDTDEDAIVETEGIFASRGSRSFLRSSGQIKPIPATATEVLQISDRFLQYNSPALVLLYDQANEKALHDFELSQYSNIHFATHGFVNEENPDLSGLLCIPDSTSGQDNVLYSSEVFNLDLNADLVVLSACETGLGKVVKGEGIVGLGRGFLYAGARNLMVSLWQVADQSTAELMTDFYSEILANQPKASALQTAKLNMLLDPVYADPFYWAPFILIGSD